jgi:hypothetical protein
MPCGGSDKEENMRFIDFERLIEGPPPKPRPKQVKLSEWREGMSEHIREQIDQMIAAARP